MKDDPKRAGTIDIAASVALKHFGTEKVMLCDHSDFRLKPAEELALLSAIRRQRTLLPEQLPISEQRRP